MIITLAQVQTAIVATLDAALPNSVSVLSYPAYEKKIHLPAVVVEIESLGRDQDPGTGQFDRLLHIEARCIVDPCLPNSQLAVRELALTVGRIANMQTWGIALSTATVGDIVEDGLRPELDGFLVWLVPWTQHVRFGAAVDWETVAIPDPASPTNPDGSVSAYLIAEYPEALSPAGSFPVRECVIGLYPDTGTGHEGDYVAPEDLDTLGL
jgi:hypothetical protein